MSSAVGTRNPQPNPQQPMSLIFDGPYDYAGYFNKAAKCHLRIYAPRGGDRSAHLLPVVIATELDDNPGTSITNVCEHLAHTVWTDRVLWSGALTPDPQQEGLIWIEHYAGKLQSPTSGNWHPDQETFSLVSFTGSTHSESGDPRKQRMGQPEWSHIRRAVVEGLIGQPFPPVPGATHH